MKTCKECGKPKKISMFYERATNADGRDTRCKECHSRRNKEKWKTDPGYKEKSKKTYARYRKRNLDQERKRCRDHYDSNKSVIRKRQNEYKQTLSKETVRRYRLKRDYGITPEKFREMLLDQGGRCAVCNKLVKGRSAHIDHDHKTGKVRGILCFGCNIGLGSLKDNITSLKAAILYLRA